MDGYQAIYDATRSRLSNCDVGAAIESAVGLQLQGASYAVGRLQDAISNVEVHICEQVSRPSVLFRPKIFKENKDTWCALYGDNLQDGIAGFGESPAEAMIDFDKNFREKVSKEQP